MSAQTVFSRAFLIATLERAIRSFAASLASLLTAAGTGLLQTDWGEKLSVAGMAALVTILLAVGGGTFGKGDGPSFTGEEKLDTEKQSAGSPAGDSAVVAAPTVPAPRVPMAHVPQQAGPRESQRVPEPRVS
ncbi:holin [Blastococcus deserti]|uniref:Holin n=1 Tax=Blastococcus deserti TaxID=2259033 RepID=A0ABW4XCY7_9ACTN